ncbi:hypothetical protein GCM10009811_03000 [Nostocoides veronense]|uniref:Uncharacterized protein n=1 Tax=Nostocoides veronense TaxID=330836 RepID=A0ABN2LAG7_9MICO
MPVTNRAIRMKTALKPAMKSSVPSTTRLRAGAATTPRGAVGAGVGAMGEGPAPATYPRNPGTSGSTHGEAKETRPARAAMAMATGNAPEATVCEAPATS